MGFPDCEPRRAGEGLTPQCVTGCWEWCLAPAGTQQVTMAESHKQGPPTATDHASSQHGQRAALAGNRPTRVRAQAYLEGRDADTIHQVWLVGLQEGDEGQQLMLAAHLVLVI